MLFDLLIACFYGYIIGSLISTLIKQIYNSLLCTSFLVCFFGFGLCFTFIEETCKSLSILSKLSFSTNKEKYELFICTCSIISTFLLDRTLNIDYLVKDWIVKYLVIFSVFIQKQVEKLMFGSGLFYYCRKIMIDVAGRIFKEDLLDVLKRIDQEAFISSKRIIQFILFCLFHTLFLRTISQKYFVHSILSKI